MLLTQSPLQLILLQGKELIGPIIATALVCICFLVFFFLINKRFVKIFCACGIEVTIWLFVRAVWGKDSLPAQILCYVTAAAAIVLTLTIVNRINWGNSNMKKK